MGRARAAGRARKGGGWRGRPDAPGGGLSLERAHLPGGRSGRVVAVEASDGLDKGRAAGRTTGERGCAVGQEIKGSPPQAPHLGRACQPSACWVGVLVAHEWPACSVRCAAEVSRWLAQQEGSSARRGEQPRLTEELGSINAVTQRNCCHMRSAERAVTRERPRVAAFVRLRPYACRLSAPPQPTKAPAGPPAPQPPRPHRSTATRPVTLARPAAAPPNPRLCVPPPPPPPLHSAALVPRAASLGSAQRPCPKHMRRPGSDDPTNQNLPGGAPP